MYQQAIDDINKAVELDPNNVNYWVEKGGACLRVNQIDEAIKALEKAISIDPQNAPAYRMLGYIQVQQKQMDKGIANLQKASDLGDEVAIGLLEKYKK
jgi:tetratricopeptide (TPR) repeat protein